MHNLFYNNKSRESEKKQLYIQFFFFHFITEIKMRHLVQNKIGSNRNAEVFIGAHNNYLIKKKVHEKNYITPQFIVILMILRPHCCLSHSHMDVLALALLYYRLTMFYAMHSIYLYLN